MTSIVSGGDYEPLKRREFTTIEENITGLIWTTALRDLPCLYVEFSGFLTRGFSKLLDDQLYSGSIPRSEKIVNCVKRRKDLLGFRVLDIACNIRFLKG